MIFVLLIYIISMLSWGAVSYQLIKAIYASAKARTQRPPLMVPLTIASVSLFIESLYFGFSAWFVFIGADALFAASLAEENWFIIKLFIAVSGVMLLFNLKTDK